MPVPQGPVGGGWAPVLRVDGPAKRDNLGWSLAPVGDLDGDGRSELLAGAPRADLAGGGWDAGAAGLYDGRARLLAWFQGPAAWARLGDRVDAGADWDGDGLPDLLLAAPDADGAAGSLAGRVELRSGAPGWAVLATWEGPGAGAHLGTALGFAGDWDGDGTSEVVLGFRGGFWLAGRAGQVSGQALVGGRAADLLQAVAAPRAGDHRVVRPRLLLGFPGADPGGLPGAGVAVVVEPGGAPVEIGGRSPGEGFGQAVAFAGDLDGDGWQEFLVGAPFADPGGVQDAGRVDLFDGATLALLASFPGGVRRDYLGLTVAPAGDVDGDGTPDLLGGSGLADGGGGLATCWSGADGHVVWSRYGKGHDTKFGFALAPWEDMDGDGRGDFVVSAPGLNSATEPDAGAVLWFAHVPFLTADRSDLSAAAGGAVRYQLAFTSWEGGGSYELLFSATGTGPTWYRGTWVPLTADGVFALSQGGGLPWSSGCTGVLDDKGRGTAAFAPPPGALVSWVGRTLWAAALADPQGRVDPNLASEAVAVAILP